jgi:uncharacterized membrane protein
MTLWPSTWWKLAADQALIWRVASDVLLIALLVLVVALASALAMWVITLTLGVRADADDFGDADLEAQRKALDALLRRLDQPTKDRGPWRLH